MNNQSEVAALRERIALETQASWSALHSLNAGTAQHQFITARFQKMEQYHKRLTQLVGEKQATEILCETFNAEGEIHGNA